MLLHLYFSLLFHFILCLSFHTCSWIMNHTFLDDCLTSPQCIDESSNKCAMKQTVEKHLNSAVFLGFACNEYRTRLDCALERYATLECDVWMGFSTNFKMWTFWVAYELFTMYPNEELNDFRETFLHGIIFTSDIFTSIYWRDISKSSS